jgi:hypothetical protein
VTQSLVVLQPHFIPWGGYFEQLKLTENFLFYDDVQIPQGRNFVSRVQILNQKKSSWLTAPIHRNNTKSLICETTFANQNDWRDRHLKTLRHSYGKTPYAKEMYDVAEEIYSFKSENLSDFNINSIKIIAQKLSINANISRTSELNIFGSSSERILDICLQLKCKKYITGLGALNYLDHELFENHGVNVEYMQYNVMPYTQLSFKFDPYVSILDFVANCGWNWTSVFQSTTIPWRKIVTKS